MKTDNIMTLENCLKISITDLTKKSSLNNPKIEVINLTKNNEHCFSVDVAFIADENEKFITFTYPNETDNSVTHKISIAFIPSNIGNGFVKYFVCPVTGKYCRKLYYHRMSFMHRKATGLLYEQQAKKQTISRAYYLTIEQRNEPNSKNFRKFYTGDYTKRYFQILLKTSNSEVIDAYEKMIAKQKSRIYC